MECRFNIVMFSETWFVLEDDVYNFPGYKSFYMNRRDQRGGGVSMLVSNLTLSFSLNSVALISTSKLLSNGVM